VLRREFLKGIGTAALLGIGGTALASCEQAPTGPRDISAQLLWILNSEFIGFYAAEKNGYYADEGLNVDTLAGGVGIPTLDIVEMG
jgi:ABC-type nitrate/sulfonate/bicarbonate transport system substrate-binding protein